MKKKSGLFVSLAIIVPSSCRFAGGANCNGAGKVSYETYYLDRPMSVGESTDMVARVSAKILQDKWGVSVNVTAKPDGKEIP
jgi:hypothetical protein